MATETHTRAALNGSTGPAQGFSYVYNNIGYLSEVKSGGGALYRRADETDGFGRLTRETLGNSLVTRRTFDTNTARLTDIDTGPNASHTVQQDGCHYDALGNLTSKTGVGSYTYPASGGASVKPHAVSSLTGTLNGVTNPSFNYDTSGNLLSGAGRSWTWTAANLPKDITQGSLKAAFLYGTERQRLRQTLTSGATTLKTIHYAGVMEKEVAGSVTQVRTYLPNGAGVIIETTGGATPGTVVRYFHRDRLGSVNVITNEAGAVVERLAYDAWGRRRNADGTDAPANLSSAIDDTGFTGHEMLDDFGLVHMNGRVYDPTLARVVSADPLLTEPGNMQGFNRYSYVSNSPLVYTDPSGFAMQNEYETDGAFTSAQQQPTVVGLPPVNVNVTRSTNPAGAGVLGMAMRGAPTTIFGLRPQTLQFVIRVVRVVGPRVGAVLGPAGFVVVTGGLLAADYLYENRERIFSVAGGDQSTSADSAASADGADNGVKIDDKINGQLGDRGWTEQDVQDAANGPPAGTTTDNRRPNKTTDRQGRNDSATVYGTKGGYVVVNDRTREVVQVSDRKPGSGWIPDSRIKWNGGN